jgi:hypothetical protein
MQAAGTSRDNGAKNNNPGLPAFTAKRALIIVGSAGRVNLHRIFRYHLTSTSLFRRLGIFDIVI